MTGPSSISIDSTMRWPFRPTTAVAGRSRVQRHQMVYAALGERMREEIHALSMRTLTPEEWKAGG